MSTKHARLSGKSDPGVDPGVRPSDYNADHLMPWIPVFFAHFGNSTQSLTPPSGLTAQWTHLIGAYDFTNVTQLRLIALVTGWARNFSFGLQLQKNDLSWGYPDTLFTGPTVALPSTGLHIGATVTLDATFKSIRNMRWVTQNGNGSLTNTMRYVMLQVK